MLADIVCGAANHSSSVGAIGRPGPLGSQCMLDSMCESVAMKLLKGEQTLTLPKQIRVLLLWSWYWFVLQCYKHLHSFYTLGIYSCTGHKSYKVYA